MGLSDTTPTQITAEWNGVNPISTDMHHILYFDQEKLIIQHYNDVLVTQKFSIYSIASKQSNDIIGLSDVDTAVMLNSTSMIYEKLDMLHQFDINTLQDTIITAIDPIQLANQHNWRLLDSNYLLFIKNNKTYLRNIASGDDQLILSTGSNLSLFVRIASTNELIYPSSNSVDWDGTTVYSALKKINLTTQEKSSLFSVANLGTGFTYIVKLTYNIQTNSFLVTIQSNTYEPYVCWVSASGKLNRNLGKGTCVSWSTPGNYCLIEEPESKHIKCYRFADETSFDFGNIDFDWLSDESKLTFSLKP